MNRRRHLRNSILWALVLGAVACDDPGAPSGGTGIVNVINGAVEAQDVLVDVDGNRVAEVCHPCSGGLGVAAGVRTFEVHAKGDPSVATSIRLAIRDGERADIAVFDSASTIAAIGKENDNGPVGPGSKFHLIHAGFTLGTVDVYVTPFGQSLDAIPPARAGLEFGQSWYAAVDPSSGHIRVTESGSKVVIGETFLGSGRTIVVFGDPAFVFSIP